MLIHSTPYLYIYISEMTYVNSSAYLSMLNQRISAGGAMACSHLGDSPPSVLRPLAPPR